MLATLLGGTVVGLAGCTSSCPDTGTPSSSYVVDTDDVGGGFDTLPGESWPSPRRTAANTGYAADASLTETPAMRWQTTVLVPSTGGAVEATSPPIVASGTVFVSTLAGVFALALRDGAARWRRELEPAVVTEPHRSRDRVVAPVVAGDRVICATDTGVVALDIADGSTVWETEAIVGAGVPTSTEAGMIVPTTDGVAMLDDANGSTQWTAPTSAVMPAVAGDTIVTGGDRATALDVATGEERWGRSDRRRSYPVVADETVCFGTGDGLAAHALADGSDEWLVDRGRFLEPPIVTPQSIYAVERPGEAGDATFAFDRVDAGAPSPRWCSEIGDGVALAATDETALVHRAPGLVGFSEDLGDAMWRHPLGTQPVAPALLDGGLVTAASDGTVTALGGR